MNAALRAAAVPPFYAMAMSRLASELEAAGRPIIHLEVGQPSTPLPALARQAVVDQLKRGDAMGYTNSPGLLSLRRRISRHYMSVYGVAVDPEAMVITAGASAGFTLAFLSAFDQGDRVAVLEPGYPCYRNTLIAIGAQPVPIAVHAAARWAPTIEALDDALPLRGLVIASPSNPTGTVLTPSALATISAWCLAHDVQLIADEIYHGITFDVSVATSAIDPDAIVINSFSKYFSMTGWRLGWIVVPPHLAGAVERLQQNLYICASHVSQVAGLAAFEAGDELEGHVRRYRDNRQILIDGLRSAGVQRFAEADGAFYVYADVSELGIDSMVLCRRWLDELNVAVTPGLDFDLARGHEFVRFSFAGDGAAIGEACQRLQGWRV